MTSALDLWLEKRFPEEFGPAAKAKFERIVADIIEETDLPPRADKEAWEEKEREAREYWIDQRESELNPSVREFLEEYDLDLRGFLDIRRKAGQQKRIRDRKTEPTERYIPIAVEAFLEAEEQRMNYTQAWQHARDRIYSDTDFLLDDRTVKKWLNEIADNPWSAIPGPKRGRPNKKE